MSDSILTSTKKILGLEVDYTAFDPDVTMFINSALGTLNQLGIGPEEGFMISDETATWEDLLGTDKRLEMVKQYIYLKVRVVFDPPDSGWLADAFAKQIEELAWRLNVVRESDAWTDPDPAPVVDPSW
jgi:hypothetical protein